MNHNKKFRAFTLPEVIMALGLIGVLLALSIPTVLNNANRSAQVQSIKKSYGILHTAINNMLVDNSGTLYNVFPVLQSSVSARNTFSNYLEYNKTCDPTSVVGNCWATTTSKLSGGLAEEGFDAKDYAGAVLSDGSCMLIDIKYPDCDGLGLSEEISYDASMNKNNVCGYIAVDTNGYLTGPNTFGRDMFMFILGPDGLYSGGDPHTEYNLTTDEDNCDPTEGSYNGYGCTNKVLVEGAMNY